MIRRVSILGATGSVGRSVADVIRSAPGRFSVQAVTAQTSVEALARAARDLGARHAVIGEPSLYKDIRAALTGTGITAAAGPGAIEDAAALPAAIVVAAIVGLAGLRPLMRALEQGGAVAIANKEPLVAAGPLVMAAARRHGATILPIDSEHNAIFQLLSAERPADVERIVLTASGGPFRTWDAVRMARATVEQALAHPTWDMGAKISVDSATMANKALEVIEAHHLFALPPEKIAVLVHPQSLVHGMVQHADGSLLAQMGPSDMRTPIAHALAWPERMPTPGRVLDPMDLTRLDFAAPDTGRFPALARAYEALAAGPGACIALNAANEVAAQAFLEGRIAFGQIAACIDRALDVPPGPAPDDLDAVEAYDSTIRQHTQEYITSCA